jgi:hypothetical protein
VAEAWDVAGTDVAAEVVWEAELDFLDIFIYKYN